MKNAVFEYFLKKEGTKIYVKKWSLILLSSGCTITLKPLQITLSTIRWLCFKKKFENKKYNHYRRCNYICVKYDLIAHTLLYSNFQSIMTSAVLCGKHRVIKNGCQNWGIFIILKFVCSLLVRCVSCPKRLWNLHNSRLNVLRNKMKRLISIIWILQNIITSGVKHLAYNSIIVIRSNTSISIIIWLK